MYTIYYYSMYAKGITDTHEIIWSNVAQSINGATPVFLRKVFFRLVQECNMNNANFAGNIK